MSKPTNTAYTAHLQKLSGVIAELADLHVAQSRPSLADCSCGSLTVCPSRVLIESLTADTQQKAQP